MTTAAELFASLIGEGTSSKGGGYRELIAASDPYSGFGDAISSFRYQPYKRGDENTAIGIALGQALLKGLAQGASKRYQGEQRRALGSILVPALSDPDSVTRPEELDRDIFDAVVLEGKKNQYLREVERQKELDDLEDRKDFASFEEDLKRGTAIDSALIANSPRALRILAEQRLGSVFNAPPTTETSLGALLPADLPAEVESQVRYGSDGLSGEQAAEPDRPQFKSVEERAREAYERALMSTDSEDQAEEAAAFVRDTARTETERELKAMGESRDAMTELKTRLVGMDKAIENAKGQGLPLQDALTGVSSILTQFDKEGGGWDEFVKDREMIDSLNSLATRFFRTAGEGQISDRDIKNFQKGLPSLSKSKAANQSSLKRLQNFFRGGEEYLKLKETFIREQGTLENFDEAYGSRFQELVKDFSTQSSGYSDADLIAEAKKRGRM